MRRWLNTTLAGQDAEQLAQVRRVVARLPGASRDLLAHLVAFLAQVMARSDANLMNATNLAVVWAPCLAWPRDQPAQLAHLPPLHAFAYALLTLFPHWL